MSRPAFHTVRALILFGAVCSAALSFACSTRKLYDPSPPHRGAVSAPILVDINAADKEQLAKLPGIGPSLAERIVEYRNRYGRFRKITHVLLIEGLSERRFREIAPLITAN